MKGKHTLTFVGLLFAVAGVLSFALLSQTTKQQPSSNNQSTPTEGVGPPSEKRNAGSGKQPRFAASDIHATGNNGTAQADEKADLSAQFEEENACFQSMSAVELAKHILEYCRSPDRSSDPRVVAQCNRLQAQFPDENPAISDFAQRDCGNAEAIPERYFQLMYAAASAGDVKAQYCFIDRDGQRLAHVYEKLDDAARQEIFETELEWTREGIQRGDWRILSHVATNLFSHGNNSSPLVVAIPGLETTGDDLSLVQYSLNRLLRFGATGLYAKELDDSIQALTGTGAYKMSADIPATVSAEDASAADAWAKATFEQYFTRSAPQPNRPEFCDNPYLKEVLRY